MTVLWYLVCLAGDEDVRGISGGQRKRVNLGIEIVADPSVLFLDEVERGGWLRRRLVCSFE